MRGYNWTPTLHKAFINSKAVKDLASGEKNVVGRLKTTCAGPRDFNHYDGETLYKLSVELKDPNAPFFEKVKSFLGLNRHCINQYSHSEKSLCSIMSSIHTSALEKIVNKKH